MGKIVGLTFAARADKAKGPSRDELMARAEALGCEVPAKATKADIEALIAAAEAGKGPEE